MAVLFAVSTAFSVFLSSASFPCLTCQVQKAKIISHRGWERLGCANQMDEEQLSKTKLAMHHLDLRH